MAAEVVAAAGVGAVRRRAWLAGTIGATLTCLAGAPLVAPAADAAPVAALSWMLFLGSSVHVGATVWFYGVPEVRAHMGTARGRYVVAPALLVLGGAVMAALLPGRWLGWLVLAFFAWQFHHFQKQNLGLCALAARTCGAAGLRPAERRVLVTAGVGGALAVAGRPAVLQLAGLPSLPWLHLVGAGVIALGVALGLGLLLRRSQADRPAPFSAVLVLSVIFFVPTAVFASPYAALAGLTVAHGLQYLLLVGLVAATPADGRSAAFGLASLTAVALAAGLALNHLSHRHGHGMAGNALFGVFLGLSAAHFVVDAGLWRLRDSFPRVFLARRVPYLLVP